MGLDVDVIDLSIFDYIKEFANSGKCEKLQTNGDIYFWISHKTLIQQLPILGITTGAGIIKRINKLIDAGLLERHPNCEMMRRTFYKFGPKYDDYYFYKENDNESLQPTTNVEGSPNDCQGITPNERLGYQTTNDNQTTIINNNKPADGGLFPDEPESEFKPITVTRPRRTSENLCTFECSRYNDMELFLSEFKGPEFANVDMVYYYHAVADWSAQKGKKMRDWIATARNFIRSDMEKNKLHTLNKQGSTLDADAMEYLQMMSE